ncbi:hypothetical protein I2494_16325 [Budviciaceae bacterium BWR-B9]|uniref:Nucleotidyltransferase domain-containing protein n=1 Tax=Limnobaculum allomyrinae TaxID=2791986 RepID=A0ABS1IU32_9GAMM|nr:MULTISPECIES: hypothetical protein [Limnobaculum]MBK5145253.1 hypothetical protein [Limnobaculum allomyrinae]MBV7693085.1 hypothetical protein [Limnobaculum sp. M2-1]
MVDYDDGIKKGISSQTPPTEIARKMFFCYPTHFFIDNLEMQYEILNDISCFFDVPISSVHIIGSAKFGKSYYKKRLFSLKQSDLDVAIIDKDLFISYMELVSNLTDNYTKRQIFPRNRSDLSVADSYISYISKGMFRPDMMPYSDERTKWNKYFGNLSNKYRNYFKNINCGIYLSESFFELKQAKLIEHYNDSITILEGLK